MNIPGPKDYTPIGQHKELEPINQQIVERYMGFIPPGYFSNQRIIQRNRGVRPQFIDAYGGCSANYR